MQPGAMLGHYRIVSALGKGGMGDVWKARDTKLDRDVAIKTLPREVAGNAEGLARFEREAKLLASLNHPNIAAVYGLDESDGTRFIAMEMIGGENLADRLTRGAIPLEETLRLAAQLVEALEAAHDRGVVHRDLKPANIMITPEGKLKVLDFGLAKALAGDQGALAGSTETMATLSIAATGRGAILGTPGYMSPEQARGEPTDQRTDIWAFGCILFEMLTGRQTFGGNTLSDSLAAVIARDPDWRIVPPSVHPRIRLLLERCLDKDARMRYHGIAEARADIAYVLADPDGIYARPASGSGRKAVLAGWLVAAVALLAAGGIAVAAWMRPAPESPVYRFVASGYPSPPVDIPAELRELRAIAISPDGAEVAYPVLAGNVVSIYLRNVGQLEGRPLGSDADMPFPFYSSDGRSIGFVRPSAGALMRASRDGSTPPETIYAYPENTFPIGASWADDDTIVFALIRHPAGLLRIPARGGEVETLTEPEPGVEHLWPDVLPGGRGVLYASGRLDSAGSNLSVEVLDLETRDSKTLIASGSQPRYIEPGILVYLDRGVLRAVRFDPGRLEVVGESVSVLTGFEWSPVTGAAQFAVSENGSLAYLNRITLDATENRRLAIVEPDGRRWALEMRAGAYMHPRVSPDGNQVAVHTVDAEGRGIVWIYDLGRNAIRQLTQAGSNVRPIWTPDGERIAFASNRDGTWGIYWQRADGSDVATRLTTADEGWEHYPDSFTRDGLQLTFTNIVPDSGGMQSIWAVNVGDGSEPRPITDPVSGGAEFSVDGNWIAYRLNNQVVVERFPRTGALYQVTQDGGSYPVWSPGGTRLLYRRIVVAGQAASTSPLVTVDATTGSAFTFGSEQVLPITGFMTFFGHRDYDFMPDGQRMVMVFPADAGESDERFVPRAHVVVNWVEELKERLSIP